MKKILLRMLMICMMVLMYSSMVFATNTSYTKYDCTTKTPKSVPDAGSLHEGCSSTVTTNNSVLKITTNTSGQTSLAKNDKYSLEVDWGAFSKLSSQDQEQLISNLASSGVYEEITTDAGVANNQQDFVNNLQNSGTGSALITLLFGNTKPNYARALEIYTPFASPLGTVLAVVVIVVCGLLVVVIAFDIAYITIPMFQLSANSKESNDGKQIKLISPAARKAANEQDNKSGAGVLWMWAKDRAALIIVLILCIMYLIDGSIFKILGSLLDLVSGI